MSRRSTELETPFAPSPPGHRPEVGDIELEGLSLGGLETTIALPKWDVCFDIGRCPPFAVRRSTVLVTHAHMDHAGGLAYHCAMRDLLHLPPPRYIVPRENLDAFHDLFEVWRRLDRSTFPCTIEAISPGETLSLGKDRAVTAFRSPHRVPCQGYALTRSTNELLPEHRGRSAEEIRALRLAGHAIPARVDRVEVAFCGDTVIDVVDREALVRTARLLILEVTFLDQRVDVQSARSKGHVHLEEVIERAAVFENEYLLFTHYSQRYTPSEVRQLVYDRVPAGLRERVRLLV